MLGTPGDCMAQDPDRIPEIVSPGVESAILELAGHVLKRILKKMDATFQLSQDDRLGSIFYRDVKKIFDLRDLYVGNRKKKEPPRYRCRYQADYMNMIWHTDLHLFHKHQVFRSLIIEWIDDRSRKWLGFKFLGSKCSLEVTSAFQEILLVYSPHMRFGQAMGLNFKESLITCFASCTSPTSGPLPIIRSRMGSAKGSGRRSEWCQHPKTLLR
jgi:hypothetical protein